MNKSSRLCATNLLISILLLTIAMVTGCSFNTWEQVSLETGLMVSMPLVGIEIDPRFKLQLGRAVPYETPKSLGSSIDSEQYLALLRLRNSR